MTEKVEVASASSTVIGRSLWGATRMRKFNCPAFAYRKPPDVRAAPVCPSHAGSAGLRVSRGIPSSSAMVRVASAGSAAPLPPAAAPVTVTVLSGAFALLAAAVTVTRPALVVDPAAMVSVRAALSAKSAARAWSPGAAWTVTVTASLDGCESDAVTVDTPPVSETDDGVSAKVTVGSASSSAMVSVASAGSATPLPPVTAPEIVTVLSGEFAPLAAAVTVTVPVLVVAPAAMVSVAAALRMKSAARA